MASFDGAYTRDLLLWNDSASRSLLNSACEMRDKSTSHGTRIIAVADRYSIADYSSGLAARWTTRIILKVPLYFAKTYKFFPSSAVNDEKDSLMSDMEQREIAETLFPSQAREEIRDAIKLEEERRTVLIKNLYRLRALRLSRDRANIALQ
jgi:hypothetical protein